jgi:hypothetical protein
MAASENMMSVGAQHALRDMVELKMYILSQPQQAPWPMLPRSSRKPHQLRKPYSNPVEWSAARELVDHGFIEATSSRTLVVSKSGYQFYEREMKLNFTTIIKGRE